MRLGEKLVLWFLFWRRVSGVVGGVRVAVRVTQHEFGVALSVLFFGGRGGSGVRRDSGCQGGRASASSEASYLEAAPAIWASARSELSGEAVKKTIWRGASSESECDQGL